MKFNYVWIDYIYFLRFVFIPDNGDSYEFTELPKQVCTRFDFLVILRPAIFEKYPEIVFGFSTKISEGREAPYHFNMSHSVGDESERVERNRKEFFSGFNSSLTGIQLQRQVHKDAIRMIKSLNEPEESDAMITAVRGIGLGISTADCNAVFLYDPKKSVVAGIHAGWRGTALDIVSKTVRIMKWNYDVSPADLVAYLAPAISGRNYQVGNEVAEYFDEKYLTPAGDHFYLDLIKSNYDQLLKEGVMRQNIQATGLCSFDGEGLFHSYRRDGEKSGRAIGVIGMTEK
ncbi:MAG: peptidoglycan editing factor PgeF [Ignavibacteriaceae bacterium]